MNLLSIHSKDDSNDNFIPHNLRTITQEESPRDFLYNLRLQFFTTFVVTLWPFVDTTLQLVEIQHPIFFLKYTFVLNLISK